jgi:hypothetical protein
MPDYIFSFLPFRHHGFSIIFAAIPAIIVGYPLSIYIVLGWKRKEHDIIGSLTRESAKLYLRTFQSFEVELDVAVDEFKRFYKRWYGRRYLIIPTIFLMVVIVSVTFVVGETSFVDLATLNTAPIEPKNFMTIPSVAIASISGAFAFIAWDIVLRTSRRTLMPADILGSTIRMILAVPLGFSISALVKEDLGAFIAFAAAAFPIEAIQTILQRLLTIQLKVELGAGTEKDQVINLSGVDKNMTDRLVDADITTILQLAYCDPVQTCMRTSLSFAVVSDISSQSLAWLYFGDNLAKLRTIGLRGACEMSFLRQDLQAAGPKAAALVQSASKSLGISEEEFENALLEISEDPYTEFLSKTWMFDSWRENNLEKAKAADREVLKAI